MIFEAQLGRLRDRWERLSARERTLVTAMGLTFLAMATIIVGFVITDGLATLDEANADARQALHDLETQREGYLKAKAKAKALETRMGTTPVQLQGFLEQVGKEAGVEIPETDEQPAQLVGSTKQFNERSVTLRLKSVTLENLTKFMKGIESGANLVAITALTIHTLGDKHENLEVEMTVTTWDRAPEKKDKDKDKEKSKKGDKT
jgi:hypothetical protein